MATVSDSLNNIEQKIRLLTARLEAFEQDANTLREQNRALRTDLLLRDSEISHLKSALTVTTEAESSEDVREKMEKNDEISAKSTESTSRTESTKSTKNYQLRLEIDRYIRQIDECIELLQQN